jgi:hypothetical protein
MLMCSDVLLHHFHPERSSVRSTLAQQPACGVAFKKSMFVQASLHLQGAEWDTLEPSFLVARALLEIKSVLWNLLVSQLCALRLKWV